MFATAEEIVSTVDGRGLVAIVTGASSGIGAETARVLASRGVHVIVAARNLDAANSVRDSIAARHLGSKVDVMGLDLASLASVRDFAREFLAKNMGLNILVNNAGVMRLEGSAITKTADGIEEQFGTNHIGHFLLTELLLENMKKTAAESGIEGRIVNLSSVAHRDTYKGGIKRSFEEINDSKSYVARAAYGQSKLANVLHASKLAKRLKEEGAAISVNSVHPGIIKTPLWKHSGSFVVKLYVKLMFKEKTVPQGAATTVYVALHPDVKGVSGKYFEDCVESRPKIKGDVEELEDRLWALSESIIQKIDEDVANAAAAAATPAENVPQDAIDVAEDATVAAADPVAEIAEDATTATAVTEAKDTEIKENTDTVAEGVTATA